MIDIVSIQGDLVNVPTENQLNYFFPIAFAPRSRLEHLRLEYLL